MENIKPSIREKVLNIALAKLSRVVYVDKNGCAIDVRGKFTLSLQDDDRTLKIFKDDQ